MEELFGLEQFGYIMGKISTIITLMVVCVIIIAIIVLMLDMFKAVMSGDHDATRKALNIAKKRLITLFLFLLVPSIVTFLINIVGGETYQFSDTETEEITGEIGESYGEYQILDGYINFSAYIKVDD